jgi:hypothetical protein
MKSPKILYPVFLFLFMLSFVNGQVLENDAVVANWTITLKSGVNAERFENYMAEEYIPAFEKNFTGVKMFLMKGERGVKKDAYLFLLLFKSIEERNSWWPQDGISSDKTKEAAAKMKLQDDRLNTMVTWDSFTDWIVM